MGTDLGELIEPEETSFEQMNDRTIAVDAMNTLYQFLSIIRQRDGTPLKDSQGRVTSHLSGLFYRTSKLFRKNIRAVYVYDGDVPDLKSKESSERRKRREKAREEWKRLKEEGKMKKAFQKATQSSKLNDEMVEESKRLLEAMGVPYVEAPSEGEAQAAEMNREGQVWAAGSQDWDSLLFGAERMARNLTITGKRKVQGKEEYREVVPETILAEDVFEDLGIDREKMVWLAVLVGTDYNPGGVEGIGPKRGLELVREHDSFEGIKEEDRFDWEHDPEPETVIQFFTEPPVERDVSFDFRDVKPGKVEEFLVEEHDFSSERVTSTLEKYVEAREETQSGLQSFM